MSIHEYVQTNCPFMAHHEYPIHGREKPKFDDLFGPTYDEVMRYGRKIRERTNENRIAQVWEYQGIQYGLVWDQETGQNLRYDERKAILQEREEREKTYE